MRKYRAIALSLIFSLAAGTTVLAQEPETEQAAAKKHKKEFSLPKAGDIQLGIDIAPIFQYVGNMFNGNTSNAPLNQFGGEWAIPSNPVYDPTVSIMGKYMITDNWAARANIGVLTRHANIREYMRDDKAYALNELSEAEVIDNAIYNTSGAAFALGAEYRRGYRWIQGIFGADLVYGFSNSNSHFKYGNAITEINQAPSRYNWGVTAPDVPYWSKSYVLDSYNNEANHYVGIDLTVGVECFLTSYLAIGGEVSLTAMWAVGAPQYIVCEGFNTLTNTVEQRTETITPGNTVFEFGTKNLGGKLYLAFYF